MPLILADAMSSFSSVILLSALSPPFSLQEVPTTYGLKVFIRSNHTASVKPRHRLETAPFGHGSEMLCAKTEAPPKGAIA